MCEPSLLPWYIAGIVTTVIAVRWSSLPQDLEAVGVASASLARTLQPPINTAAKVVAQRLLNAVGLHQERLIELGLAEEPPRPPRTPILFRAKDSTEMAKTD